MKVSPNILGGGYAALVFFVWISAAMDYESRIHNTIVCLRDKKIELNKIVLRVVFLVLWIMAAFRGMDIANDTVAYYRTYQKIAYSGFAGETRMEIGYVALNIMLTHIFHDNLVGFHVLLFITSAFSYWTLEQWIERHANTYGICIVAFYFLSNSSYMSAIRQSVAVGFILLALMKLEEIKGNKGYIVYVILAIAASLFHKTAIIAIFLPILIKRSYTRNTSWLLIAVTLIVTLTNMTGRMISFIGLGTGYVTNEIGNAANVGIMSLLYLALLLLRTLCDNNDCVTNQDVVDTDNIVYKDSFFTYCIAISLAVTFMSLRAAGMSRLNLYLQLIGLPYVSNIMRRIENQRIAFIAKSIFSMAIWGYSVIALIYRPEWQHIWPYHFYWQ